LKKRVLILGVGNAQVDAIRHCKELGCEVFGVSYRSEGRGLALVDHFERINIVDKPAVLDHARRIDADVIYSVGSDLAMPTAGYVSERLGKPFFVSEAIAGLMQNKGLMRGFLRDNDLSPVPFQVAGSLGELADWDIFPAIIKPLDSQGQRGVFELSDTSELERNFTASQSFSRTGQVIVERYIDGPELSVNAFVYNDEIIYSFTTDRHVVEGLPGGIVSGHSIPAGIDDEVRGRVDRLVEEVVRALGIHNGPVYFQLKYTDPGAFVIEVAPRLDGCHIWRLIKLKYGVDLLDLTFRLLLEGSLPSPQCPEYTDLLPEQELQLEFLLQEPFSRFRIDERFTRRTFYEEHYYRPGDEVRAINEQMEKTGYRIKPER